MFSNYVDKKNWRIPMRFCTMACFESVGCCWNNPIFIPTHTLLSFALESRHSFSDGDEFVQGLFWAYSERYFQIFRWYTFCPISKMKWPAECSDEHWSYLKPTADIAEVQQFLSTFKMKLGYLLTSTSFPHQLDAIHPHLPEGCS